MFDIGLSEVAVIFVVLLLVLGPKRLPHAAKVAGLWLGRMRQLWGNVKREANQAIDHQNVKKEANQAIDHQEDSALSKQNSASSKHKQDSADE